MPYTHITIQPVPVPLETLLTNDHALALAREMRTAQAAPELVKALRAVQTLIAGNQPVDIPGALMVLNYALKLVDGA